MVTISNYQTRTAPSVLQQTISIILNGQSLVLLRRQVNLLFRQPIGFWLFGSVLILISFGFVTQYGALAAKTYDLSQLSIIGNTLLNNYRLFTFITLVIMVPIIGVASITQEREANTLDLMLTTGITPLEFIFSKVASSLAVIFVAIFATLPILAITLSMGGVSPLDVIAMFLLEIFIAISGICVGISMGAMMASFPIGLISSYTIILVIFYPAWRMAAFGTVNENLFRAYPGIVAMMFLSFVLIRLVPALLTREINKVKPKSWRPISIKGVDAQLWTFLGTRDYLEPIQSNENPIYVSERERFLSAVTRRDFDAPSVLWLVSILLFYIALKSPTFMLQFEYVIVLFFVPSVAATMFSGEHERKSWESLRASLISSTQIFWGKIRLAIGQGLVHVYASYIPALMVLGMIWLLISFRAETSYYKTINLFTVWGGHGLILIIVSIMVCFISSLSMFISSLYKRNLYALMTAYSITFLFLYLPIFLKQMHPFPGAVLGGEHPMDIFSYILGVWHSPFIFNVWPKVKTNNAQAVINPLFWKLYIAHLSLLASGTVFFFIATWRRIKLSEE